MSFERTLGIVKMNRRRIGVKVFLLGVGKNLKKEDLDISFYFVRQIYESVIKP